MLLFVFMGSALDSEFKNILQFEAMLKDRELLLWCTGLMFEYRQRVTETWIR